MACILGAMSTFNSSLAVLQRLLYGRKIERTDLAADPIFVVGHWRSGTTLLHELLVLDENFTFPNTYACFSPNHFLVSEVWLKGLLSIFLPRKRPMDNMAIGWNLPQEDEWALCNMGMPSPYLKIMFPNLPVVDRAYQDLRGLPAPLRRQWQDQFMWLLKALTARESKRIILKTPVHTFRVAALLEILPNARFIHISRNPMDLFPSTIHTWKRMYQYQGLQVPRFEDLEEEVLQTFCEMYQAFDADRHLLKSQQFFEVKYEDVAADPIASLKSIYAHFNLPVHTQVMNSWQAYVREAGSYKKNRYELSESQQLALRNRWASYFNRYGYTDDDE